MASSAALKRFQGFHGRAPSKIRSVELPLPNDLRKLELVYLGRAIAIEYESDKVMHKADRRLPKSRTYRHEFGAGVEVYCDASGRVGIIRGGKFRVTDWMRD